jgi:hypothetical protein
MIIIYGSVVVPLHLTSLHCRKVVSIVRAFSRLKIILATFLKMDVRRIIIAVKAICRGENSVRAR